LSVKKIRNLAEPRSANLYIGMLKVIG